MGLTPSQLTQFVGMPLFAVLCLVVGLTYSRLSSIPQKNKHGNRPFRVRGIQLPWDAMQLLTVAAFLYQQFVFWALLAPGFATSVSTLLMVAHGVLTAIIFVLWLWLSLTDPACTSGKVKVRPGPEVGIYAECDRCDAGEGAFYIGSGRGTGTRRKHCGFCKKCVVGYDHHCWFLNTCISSYNYPAFFAIITLAILILTLEVSASVCGMVTLFGDVGRGLFDDATLTAWVQSEFSSWTWVVWVGAAEASGFMQILALCALLGYHSWLKWMDTTTFSRMDFIYPDEKDPEPLTLEADIDHADVVVELRTPGIEIQGSSEQGNMLQRIPVGA